MSKKCFVHSERKHLATGYIYAVRRKWIEVALTIKGEEYSADCKKDAFVKNQQPFIERGRYIAISTTGRIHMCTCVWTKAMIDQAHERAKQLSALLDEIAEYKPLAE
jgi:hypothetical protein